MLHSNLIGRFNLNNLLASLITLSIISIPLNEALEYLLKLHGVSGRMELLGGGTQPYVVVDFSHTPDSLTQALVALREYCQGNLWCVFGCGGDRDAGKRPMMGQCAEMYADHVILTDDNPRHEDSLAIISAIKEGMLHPESCVVEHDRKRAIAHALACAHPKDIVLIAGKGHEKYQQVGDEKHPLDHQNLQDELAQYWL